jgi:hypothetical protein
VEDKCSLLKAQGGPKKTDPPFLTNIMLNFDTWDDKPIVPLEFYFHEVKNRW